MIEKGLLQTTTALYVISKSRWQRRGRFEELPLRLLVGMTRLEFQNFSGLELFIIHASTKFFELILSQLVPSWTSL